MSKYIHYFNNENDFDEMRSVEKYYEPWLSFTKQNKTQTEDIDRSDYNKTEEEKERERLKFVPLTFEIQSDGNIIWKSTNTGVTRTIEYSKDNGQTWTSITSATGDTAPSISVESGDTVQFRGDNTAYGTSGSYYSCFSGNTAQFSIKGNVMSLINSTDFSDLTTLESAYTFGYLFRNCTGLTDASNLLLPATKLASNCYSDMFYGCTSLTTAPELPASALTESCYSGMFYNCNSLTTAPELPATTLEYYCYQFMFYGCTSLTTAPALPATTLVSYCYEYMFQGCTNLVQAPELPATTLTKQCYMNMFQGCTSLTTAPTLPATTLAQYCYYQMFSGCSSLNYIKCLATNISATDCTKNWVSGVASTGTFVKPASTDWSSKTGDNGIPNNWTVQDAS